MRYFVLSGVPREEFLADTIEEANDRAKLSAKNNDESSVWVEVARYERSEEVHEISLVNSNGQRVMDLAFCELCQIEHETGHHAVLAQSSNQNDASGTR